MDAEFPSDLLNPDVPCGKRSNPRKRGWGWSPGDAPAGARET
jgi:hypothetical protein